MVGRHSEVWSGAYRREMAYDGSVQGQERRSNRSVALGLALILLGLVTDARHLTPPVLASLAAVAGFGLVMYGVHLSWQVYYDREPPGSSS